MKGCAFVLPDRSCPSRRALVFPPSTPCTSWIWSQTDYSPPPPDDRLLVHSPPRAREDCHRLHGVSNWKMMLHALPISLDPGHNRSVRMVFTLFRGLFRGCFGCLLGAIKSSSMTSARIIPITTIRQESCFTPLCGE